MGTGCTSAAHVTLDFVTPGTSLVVDDADDDDDEDDAEDDDDDVDPGGSVDVLVAAAVFAFTGAILVRDISNALH